MMIELSDRSFRRMIAVEPIADNAPVVTLAAPAHDSVLRDADGPHCARRQRQRRLRNRGGVVRVHRQLRRGRDVHLPIRQARRRSNREMPAAHRSARRSRSIRWRSSPATSCIFAPWHAMRTHVSGPGVGASDTRTLRIARADEYDSVAVEAADPAEADKSVISERMLITLAEALERKRPALSRDALVGESRAIAADQRTFAARSARSSSRDSAGSDRRGAHRRRLARPRQDHGAAARARRLGHDQNHRSDRLRGRRESRSSPSINRCSKRTTRCGTPPRRSRWANRHRRCRTCAARSPRSNVPARPSASICVAARRPS